MKGTRSPPRGHHQHHGGTIIIGTQSQSWGHNHGDTITTKETQSPPRIPPPWGHNHHQGDTATTRGTHTTHHHGGHCHCGDTDTMGTPLSGGTPPYRATAARGVLPPQGHHHEAGAAGGTPSGPPPGATLVILLGPLEEGELSGVVHHGELPEQGADDLAGTGVREDVQVLDGASGQVEGRAALHPRPALPRPPPRPPLGSWHGDGTRQLQLHLDEAGEGAVLVLPRGET